LKGDSSRACVTSGASKHAVSWRRNSAVYSAQAHERARGEHNRMKQSFWK